MLNILNNKKNKDFFLQPCLIGTMQDTFCDCAETTSLT